MRFDQLISPHPYPDRNLLDAFLKRVAPGEESFIDTVRAWRVGPQVIGFPGYVTDPERDNLADALNKTLEERIVDKLVEDVEKLKNVWGLHDQACAFAQEIMGKRYNGAIVPVLTFKTWEAITRWREAEEEHFRLILKALGSFDLEDYLEPLTKRPEIAGALYALRGDAAPVEVAENLDHLMPQGWPSQPRRRQNMAVRQAALSRARRSTARHFFSPRVG
jgi:hypothetical protein